MKKETVFFSLYKSFRENIRTEPMVSLGNMFMLPVLLKRIGWRVIFACFPKIRKLRGRVLQLLNFGQHLLRMRNHHGSKFVVKYLKSSQLAISKAIAGNPFKSLQELEPDLPLPGLTPSGLPRVIPLGDRRAILSGSPSVIRWWLTLFGLYRIVQIPGEMKVSTITEPYSGSKTFLREASYDLEHLCSRFQKVLRWNVSVHGKGLLFLESASPSFVVSWIGIVHDAVLLRHYKLSSPLVTLMDAFFGKESGLKDVLENIWYISDFPIPERRGVFSGLPLKDSSRPPLGDDREEDLSVVWGRLGQLQTKLEAAGKVRVFAMVDIWTQSVLKPLHDMISEILKSLPNDGTFDQRAAVNRCFSKVKLYGHSFGYDLSAATDRLPIDLQVSILTPLIGAPVAEAWKSLLVDRVYMLETGSVVKGTNTEEELKYAVGQPMGALSSFNMLALTHHLIVQWCAIKARVAKHGVWWDGYELLGDDIVIFHKLVAEQYLIFMSNIGMEVNVKKSVVAVNETFEFAKVTGHRGMDVSALSWRMFISENSFLGRVNIAHQLLVRGIGSASGEWLANILRHRRWDYGQLNLSIVALWSMFGAKTQLGLEPYFLALISESRARVKPLVMVSTDLRSKAIRFWIDRYLAGKDIQMGVSSTLRQIWRELWPYLKAKSLFHIKRTWIRFFSSADANDAICSKIADNICKIICSGWSETPLGAPKGLCELQQAMDQLWWDIYDHVKVHMDPVRKELDHVGQEVIEDLSLDDLAKAELSCEGLSSIVDLPARAVRKVVKGSEPPVKEFKAVDGLKWLSAARRLRNKRVAMNWVARGWETWMH